MRRLVLLVAGLGALVMTGSPTLASESDALELLQKAAKAARDLSYSGTQYVSAWAPDGEETHVVDLTHVPGQGFVVDVERTASTAADDAVTMADTPAVDARALAILAEHYDLVRAADDECAGRTAHVVEVRTDKHKAAQLWLDSETGLVLRREVYDSAGRLVRASAFVHIDLRDRSVLPVRGRSLASPPRSDRLSDDEIADLRDAGWSIPARLPHDLELYEARSRDQDGKRVLHLTYTDGLSTVSLFVQRGRMDADRVKGWRSKRMGGADAYVAHTLPHRVAWGGDGRVYTLVADAPPETVPALVRALPHREESRGLLARIGRGLAKLGGWLNPFD